MGHAMRNTSQPPLSYRDAGVDIDAGNSFVERIKPSVKATARDGVIGAIGGFGGLFRLPVDRYQQPILVSGADGVGTKLRLAIDQQRFHGVGIDLVAMCANDILVCGAEPLYFLDYYATASLDVDTASCVVQGIANGCQQAGMALLGGETAEMPGMYQKGDFDLAGFAVGVVEESQIIDASHVTAGDVVLGLASSGAHSNGYSLIRKVLEREAQPTQELLDALLQPTRIYVKSVHQVLQHGGIHAMSHITGGGISENLPRSLPEHCDAVIDLNAWPRHNLFQWLQQSGGVSDDEMLRTFNCGIGFVLIVAADQAQIIQDKLSQSGEKVYTIGTVKRGQGKVLYQ